MASAPPRRVYRAGAQRFEWSAASAGIFQIENRAQMSMLPRLNPRNCCDLIIEVSIAHPGPITGEMIHPYLRQGNGEAPVVYPLPVFRVSARQDARRAALSGAGDDAWTKLVVRPPRTS